MAFAIGMGKTVKRKPFHPHRAAEVGLGTHRVACVQDQVAPASRIAPLDARRACLELRHEAA